MSIQTCWLFVAQTIAFCQKCCEFLLLKPGGVLASNETQDQWLFLYTTYILCSGGYMLPTTFYDTQKQPLTRNGFDKRLFLLLPGAFCSCQPLSWNSRIQRTKQQEVLMSIYIHVQLYFNVHMYKPQMPLKIS